MATVHIRRLCKGQLNSEWIDEVIVSPQKPTKNYKDFCPTKQTRIAARVSVQGVKSLGGHFACLCRGFEFYEVKNKILLLFLKKKMEILLHF